MEFEDQVWQDMYDVLKNAGIFIIIAAAISALLFNNKGN